MTDGRPSPDDFLALYRAIGASVQWDSRSRMDRAALRDHLAAPTTRVFLLTDGTAAAGLCEFEGCGTCDVQLAHFGVVPALRGSGLGRLLLFHALSAVWRPGVTIRLETDTNDDPRAIGVYRDAGFLVTGVGPKDFPD